MAAETKAAAQGRTMAWLRRFIEAPATQRFIMAVIVVNAVVLGLETSSTAMSAAGGLLKALDQIAVAVFVVEITIKLVVYRLQFFRGAWNVFDFTIVAITLAPAGEGLSVLRALRVMRALRLISLWPRMRLVVQALLHAIPGMGSIIALLSLQFYVAAVMATKLFGADFPDWFGTVGHSLYSLFQIMTLESWSMGIVRPVMATFPYAWMFFVPFILVTTFAVLNLFIAIVVNSMQEVHHEEEKILRADHEALHGEHGTLIDEIRALRAEVAAMRAEGRAEGRGGVPSHARAGDEAADETADETAEGRGDVARRDVPFKAAE